MSRKLKAKELFLKGNNCSQSVFVAFSDVTKLDDRTALLISSSFGGGMGHIGETCGAVTGMFMAAGMLFGYFENMTLEVKKAHYAKIKALADRFKDEFGELHCPNLMQNLSNNIYILPKEEDYKNRPCLIFVEKAVEILEEILQSENN